MEGCINFLKDANFLVNNPPTEVKELGVMLENLFRYIEDVNSWTHAILSEIINSEPNSVTKPKLWAELNNIVKDLENLSHELYFSILCDKYALFIEAVELKLEHPASGAMVILLLISSVVAILDSLYRYTAANLTSNNGEYILFKPDNQDRMIYRLAPMNMTTAIRDMGLCIDAKKDVSTYSVKDIIVALRLTSLEWWRLTPSVHLLKYILGLIHRGCLVMSRVGSEAINNMRNMRKPLNITIKKVDGKHVTEQKMTGNYDFLRRLAGGATQMIVVLRWRMKIEIAPSLSTMLEKPGLDDPETVAKACDAINAQMTRAMQDMIDAPTLHRERRDAFNISAMNFGDLDIFVEKCNSDPQKPIDVVFTAKPSDAQNAWMMLNQSVNWLGLCAMREDTPGFIQHYNDIYTFGQHFYSQDLKLYLAETYTRKGTCNLCVDFFVTENRFVKEIMKAMEDTHPVLVRVFGRTHVIYEKRLHPCTSIEHAIYVWAMIMRHAKKGVVNKVNIDSIDMPCIGDLLNEKKKYHEDDKWKRHTVSCGAIDDF